MTHMYGNLVFVSNFRLDSEPWNISVFDCGSFWNLGIVMLYFPQMSVSNTRGLLSWQRYLSDYDVSFLYDIVPTKAQLVS